jgi:hypothetical protein
MSDTDDVVVAVRGVFPGAVRVRSYVKSSAPPPDRGSTFYTVASTAHMVAQHA